MSVMLLALAEGRPGRAIPVDLPDFVIGRDPSCQLRLDHEAVGGRHCRIRRDGRRVVVEDLTAGAGAGTTINERAVRVAEVRHGDRLSVGPARFQFIIGQDDAAGDAPNGPAGTPAGRVRLIVESGKVKGQAIEINDASFLIGRDPACHLRPNNPTTSRKHAVIERRGGRIFVRDLGTTNGTILNDRNLRGEEAEATDGDRLMIGPLAFTVSIEPIGGAILQPDPEIRRALEEGPTSAEEPTLLLMPASNAAAGPAAAPRVEKPEPAPRPSPDPNRSIDQGLIKLPQLGLELAGDILIVTIRTARLDDTEATAGPIRYGLATLLEQGYPNRLVVNLDAVQTIARRSAGVIFAHAQRLVRARGLMRLCNLRPEVRAQLDELGLILPVETFDSVEEAVRTPW